MSKRTQLFVTPTVLAVAVWLLLLPVDVPAQVASVSTVPARVFPDGPVVEGGTSTLVRNDGGVTATMKTSELEPGAAYTLWWVIFNHPENCSPPRCSLDDVVPFPGNEAAGTSLAHASGHVVGSNGEGDFAGHLKAGDPTGVMFGPGLSDPIGASVHLVLRNHGQPIPDELDSQVGSFVGGCGTNTCSNEQMAIHEPFSDPAANQLANIETLVRRVAQALGVLRRGE